MANLNAKFKKILKDLESNISDKEDLEYVKTKVFEIYNLLFEEVNKLEELAESKIAKILEAQLAIEEKIEKAEKDLREIQEDLYNDESDFSISCPYCNNEFLMDGFEFKDEIECPECENIIELDWGNEEEHSCGGCGGCGGHNHDDEDDDM
ncbi:MAG: hypothetical protein FWC68_03690 [Oscillospiraceae bacterium]|nr:hypothetical protein [Oscillospiraceae bacterium]